MVKYLLILIFLLKPGLAQDLSLQASLMFVPKVTTTLSYINWSQLRSELNVEMLSSSMSMDEKSSFLLSAQSFIPGTIYDSFTISEYWGWDPSQLLWEVSGSMEEGSFAILAFSPQFDIVSLQRRYLDYGFAMTRYPGLSYFTHTFSPEPWMHPLMLRYSALLEDHAILIIATTEEAMKKIFDAYNQKDSNILDNAAISSLAMQLDKATTAILGGQLVCMEFGLANKVSYFSDPDTAKAILEELQGDLQQLHPYLALGLGYQFLQEQALVTVAVTYASKTEAQADLEPRRLAVQQGQSFVTGQLYSDYFSLKDGRVEDNHLILELTPIDKYPARMFSMFTQRDMMFAACP
jgi:hypothetical protein